MFDAIVVGLGGVGSSACYNLAKQGLQVLGIDRYCPPHPYGSSHGDTRIIRKSYFEHPSYVPLLQRAYTLWCELEEEAGKQLYFPTGLLEIGPADGVVIQGVLRSASDHDLPVERMSMQQAKRQFPGINGEEDWQVLFEKDAGYLLVDQCVETQIALANHHGATIKTNCSMVRWNADHHEVQVETQSERFIAKKLILCAGPWADQALLEYRLPLKVLHKHLYWYRCENPLYQQAKGFPCFFFDTPTGYYYGFPAFDESGLKVARHSGGTPVAIPGSTRAVSLDGTHHREEEDQRYVEDFLRMYMPSVIPASNAPSQPSRWKGCYYTMTPDEHFIVDVLPDHDNVFVIAGLSGHGFKFTSVLGELASQFVMEKPIGFDLDFLKMSRFQKASTQ